MSSNVAAGQRVALALVFVLRVPAVAQEAVAVARPRQLRPDAAQHSDPRRERIAIVLDNIVKFAEERCRLLVG